MVSILPYGFVEKRTLRLNHMPSFTGLFLSQEGRSVPVYEDIIVNKTTSRPSGVSSPGGGGGSGEPVIAKVVIPGERDNAYLTHTRGPQ